LIYLQEIEPALFRRSGSQGVVVDDRVHSTCLAGRLKMVVDVAAATHSVALDRHRAPMHEFGCSQPGGFSVAVVDD
jgi:hypothetical protein